MVIKIKNKNKSLIVLSLFIFACFSPMLAVGQQKEDSPLVEPTYSWQENLFSYSFDRVWDGDSAVYNYSGSYSDVFHTSKHAYNETEGTWTREIRTTDYFANYSLFSNTTIKGYMNLNMDVDFYQVNIQVGEAVDLIWMALKNGTFESEIFYEKIMESYAFIENYSQAIVQQFTKFDVNTWDVLDEWTENYTEIGVKNMTYYGNPDPHTIYRLESREFSMPVILVMQVFTTKNKDKIAWSELIYDYIVYKEKDQDGIFSAGETEDSNPSDLHLGLSDEYLGFIQPVTFTVQYFREDIYPEEPESNWNGSAYFEYPLQQSKSINEIASGIQFTPPTVSAENVISWDVKYPQFPMYAFIRDTDLPSENWYSSYENSSYSDTSPGDFSYGFDYNITENHANLDFTLGLSKVSDPDLYNAAQGTGLCLPHYNFFLASFDITEEDPKELTVPSGLFLFESNSTTVAEINLINPKKKEYTLYDYPTPGENSQLDSYGGSLHKLLTAKTELMGNGGNPILNIIYAIEEVVAADPTFTVADDLYHLETQNYPVWNGERLVHDPTYTIYYEPQNLKTLLPSPSEEPAISGYNVIVIFAIAGLIVSLRIRTNKKRKQT